MIAFKELVLSQRGYLPQGTLLVFDPGETTGVAVFKDCALVAHAQVDTGDLKKSYDAVKGWIDDVKPDMVVMEDYRIYAWKTKEHAWSAIWTVQLIGIIGALCVGHDPLIPTKKQGAGLAKGFCNNDKLKEWDMYVKGKQHTRDAIRHGCYYLLFSKEIKDGKI